MTYLIPVIYTPDVSWPREVTGTRPVLFTKMVVSKWRGQTRSLCKGGGTLQSSRASKGGLNSQSIGCTRVIPIIAAQHRHKIFVQRIVTLPYLDPPSSSSHSIRSVDRTLGLWDLVKSERLAILVKTPV